MSSQEFSHLRWRKSSHSSGGGGSCVEVAALWRKSSYSTGSGESCIEVAGFDADRLVAVRDSKDPDGPVLSFTPDEWAGLLARIKSA